MSGWNNSSVIANATKVEIEPSVSFTRDAGSFTSNALIAYNLVEAITKAKYKYVGLTKSAAAAIATSLSASSTYITATPRLTYGGAGYDVNVTVYSSVTTGTAV